MESSSTRLLLLTALLPLAACQGNQGSGRGGPDRPILEERNLSQDDVETLDRLSKLWVASPEEYQSEKLETLMRRPQLGPWLCKSLTVEAVRAADHMRGQQVRVRGFMQTRKAEESFLGRTRQELASFGETGDQAICVYLLRDRRSEVREVGLILLERRDWERLRPSLQEELAARDLNSTKALLELLGLHGQQPEVLALLQRLSRDGDWQVRGTTLRPYARAMKAQKVEDASKRLWKHYIGEEDGFVRRQALEAVGELGDTAQIPTLIEVLERLEREDPRRSQAEREACVRALEMLTKARPGMRAAAWKKWLKG